MRKSKIIRLSALAMCLCMVLTLCTSCALVDKIRQKLGLDEPEIAPSVLEYKFNGEGYTVTGVGTCYDTDVVIPETYNGKPVTAIAEDAFWKMKSFMSIGSNFLVNKVDLDDSSVPKMIVPVNPNFMQSLTIPKTVTSIGARALRDCDNLVKIKIADDNPVYYSEGNCIIEKETKKLIAGCNGSAIPDDVQTIAAEAFYTCNSLEKLHLPASVTLIEGGAVKNCIAIGELTVAEENTVYFGEGNCIVEKETKKLVMGCSESVIPECVTVIGASAFEGCTELKTITLPEGITTIEMCAFANCISIESIVIPKSVLNMGKDAMKLVSEGLFSSMMSSVGDGYYVAMDGNGTVLGKPVSNRTCTIYCEAESASAGWDKNWYTPDKEGIISVYWADQWEYVDGVPTLK